MSENKITNYPVDYAELKKAIRKCAIPGKGIEFIIDFEKLNELVAEYGLTAVENKIKSRRVNPEDVVYVAEFFKDNDLRWVDQYKHMSSVIFIKTDAIDDEACELMEDLKKPLIDFPEIDKVACLTTLLAKYPCYTASIISYKSTDPKRLGLLCTQIVCKANLVLIRQDNALYHRPKNNNAE